jgi:flagellar hook-associated protein 1 FlgK
MEAGRRALLASKFGIDTTSNNIANINTPGYTRRKAIMAETDPLKTPQGFVGTGVLSERLKDYREEFYDKEIRSTLSRQSGIETDEKIYQRIEAVLAEPSDNGLNEMVSKFFNSFEDLALKPENTSLRDFVIDLGKNLAERFNVTAEQLSDIRREMTTTISSNIDQANALIVDIAGLNKEIASTWAPNSDSTQTFFDQREQKLEELSKIVGVNVTAGDYGTNNVFINGINIITGATYSKLKVNEEVNNVTGETGFRMTKLDPNGVSTSLTPQSGELASLLKHYNITLDEFDSSGGFTMSKKLNDLSSTIVSKVNALSVQGYGLDDKGPAPPGRPFFDPAGTTAATIKINQDLISNPRALPLADVPNEPGNNAIALAIARLSTNKAFLEGGTPSEYYAGVLGKLGTISAEVQSSKATTELVAQQLNNQRESATGVNLDEEAINLIKYQKAFEASSRIISTINGMMSTIVNLGT